MPAERLSGGGASIGRSDVVGCDADSVGRFIRHVALSAGDSHDVKSGDSIEVNHMGPPLVRSCNLQVHVYGTIELNDDELNQIELFIDEHLSEQEAQQLRQFANYIVHPHSELSSDGSFRRFSCVGYVLEAYGEAGIYLVDMAGVLPVVDLETLFEIYVELRRIEQDPRLRERAQMPDRQELGLQGDGPWPVLLPGYVFHSLARQPDEIRSVPYKPAAGDERFPCGE